MTGPCFSPPPKQQSPSMSDQNEPLVAEKDESAELPLTIPRELPVLPLRDTVLFPNSFMPLAVAREASVRLIDEATSSAG
jgi:ATP-dependent Lon protease